MSEASVIVEPPRQTPVLGSFDVVVLGGGPAGIAAATAAARAGRSTLLIERYGFLGGMGTAAGVTNFCGLHANIFGENKRVVRGLADDLLGGIEALGGLSAPHEMFQKRIMAQAYDNAAYKLAADALLTGSGSQVLFHAYAVGVAMRSLAEIDALFIETKSGRMAVRAKVYIDCSGDGDLAAAAGVPYEKGDAEHGMLYPSTMFRVNGVDPVRAGNAWEGMGVLMEAARAQGREFPRKTPIVRPQKNPVEWRANVTQLANPDGSAIDGTDAVQLSYAELLGRRQVADFFEFLRGSVPGFENSYVLEIAPQVGIRETRRILGEYRLSEQDVLGCANFSDTIGVNGWPVEAHVAGDIVFKFFDVPNCRGFNQLPYRMLVPQGIDNLLVAGRCASMTHMGQSAARVTGACLVMGEAAGTAAAQAIAQDCSPRMIDIPVLQRTLEGNGVYLGRDM